MVITIDQPKADGTAAIHFLPVSVGRDYGGTVEIQGVAAGAKVVSNPSADLADGMTVVVAKTAEAASGK
jgi:hypothetical protein